MVCPRTQTEHELALMKPKVTDAPPAKENIPPTTTTATDDTPVTNGTTTATEEHTSEEQQPTDTTQEKVPKMEEPPPIKAVRAAPGMSATSGPLEDFPEGGDAHED